MTLTPGAYLKARRNAAGKSVTDVAGAIATDPATPEYRRVEWLLMLEADVVPAGWPTIVALRQQFPIDLAVLERLTLLQLGADLPAPRLCRGCGATETGPLAVDVPAWGWAEPDQCIPCASASEATV